MLAGWASAVDDAVLVAQRRRRLHDVLRQAGVGEAFLAYLRRFAGMVEGGRPGR